MIKFIGKNEFALSRYKELYLETIELMKNSSEEDFDFEKMSEIYMIIDEEAKSKQSDVKLKKDFALDMDKVIAFEDKNLKSRLLKQLEKSEDEPAILSASSRPRLSQTIQLPSFFSGINSAK